MIRSSRGRQQAVIGHEMNRRSFLLRITGGALGVSLVVTGAAAKPNGRGGDGERPSRRGSYRQGQRPQTTGLTDRDPWDPIGNGTGCCSDRDPTDARGGGRCRDNDPTDPVGSPRQPAARRPYGGRGFER